MTSIATVRGEPELVELRTRAEALALERRERVTSAHLLVAMADSTGAVSELLRERRLTRETLLKAARSSSDDELDPLRVAIQKAREVARSVRASEPKALHLLVALLSGRRSAAFRALDQSGIDVARLRTAAVNLSLRAAGRPADASTLSALGATPPGPEVEPRRAVSRAVSVPLMPAQIRPSSAPRTEAAPPVQVASVQLATLERTVAVPEKLPLAPRQVAAQRRTRKRARKNVFALDPKEFKALSALGRNLSAEALEQYSLESNAETQPSTIGRELEVDRVLDVLAKRQGNNPCLVGATGVGKTSVVRALVERSVQRALEHADGAVSSSAVSSSAVGSDTDDLVIVEVALSELLSATALRGAMAQRFSDLKKEIRAAHGKVVLFFDDMQQLFGPESSEELVGEIRRALVAGEIRCIGTLGPQDYERLIEGHPSYGRVFARVDVEEPSVAVAEQIVQSQAQGFAEHHGVGYEPEALGNAVAWSARYVAGRMLPEKAIAIVDLAGAKARRRGVQRVTAAHVAEVVSELAQVPTERLLETDGERMLRLESTLAESVVGHTASLSRIASILRRNAAGLGGQRPIGTFLLLGPTGVGKTETAKAIASSLFGSATALTRLDLSEYSEAHAVARLIGAPPGYVGHEAGGQLTQAVRRRPYQVLLLDEVEKAHQDVLEAFLPLFDEGRLTDGRGRTVDFTNTVIVLTSNIGAREATKGSARVGFGQRSQQRTGNDDRVVAAAREQLSPEFFNRLDEVLVFGALSEPEVEEIARRLLQRLADNVYQQRSIELDIDVDVVRLLLEQGGYDAALGARPMKRAIARLVEAPLAELLLAGSSSGERIAVGVSSGQVRFTRQGGRWAAAE